MFYRLLLALLLIPVLVSAQVSIPEKTVTVNLVHVIGENSLNTGRARQLFSILQGEYQRQTSLNIRIRYFRTRNDRLVQNLRNRNAILKYYQRVFSSDRRAPADISMAILPPIKEGGVYYLAGLATGTCRLRSSGIAVANAEERNSAGVPRFINSIVVVMHEMGHLLGANHIDTLPATTMHSNALAYVDAQGGRVLQFHPKSVKEILNCTKRL